MYQVTKAGVDDNSDSVSQFSGNHNEIRFFIVLYIIFHDYNIVYM